MTHAPSAGFRFTQKCICVALTLCVSACLPAGLLTPGSGRPGGQGNRFDSGATATAPANGRTLLAIYMVGSDLEDDVAPRDGTADETASGARSTAGAGSNDLRELLKGFESLSPDERQNVDLVVAFGGPRKAGWQGVKVVDLAGLRQDATDNYFGNDGAYLYEDATADMAQQATFQDFLRRVRVRGQGAGKVIFDVWDHGGSYDGVGFD
ncbi:MAG: hypothetical protein H7338_16040, partial [Candidatus Sericytochromatia bacterium]|nr:hypothetical protein [Candidatus Sericytochromatia bacterium]